MNIEHRTSNIEHRTSNIEHRTSDRARQNRVSETSTAPDHERILKVSQHETTPQPTDYHKSDRPDSTFSLQIQKQGSTLPRQSCLFAIQMKILRDILTYAYRGSGKYVLILCVILSMVAKLAGIAPLVGPIAGLLLSAYFCAIYFQMIQSSATGGKEAPEFPDTANFFEDIIWPMLQIFVVGLVSFGPAFGYLIWSGDDHVKPFIAYGLLGFGVIYFPMAMLAVVVLGYTGALGPHIVIPAIFRAGWLYWFAVLMLCLLYFAESVIESALSGLFIIKFIVLAFVGVYTLMTNARILGIVYRERQEELGWL